jgi:CopG family transcriptional regulator, nickel-responsive regulator
MAVTSRKPFRAAATAAMASHAMENRSMVSPLPARNARMASDLVRFGVAMEKSLLDDFDTLVEARKVTRSELLRDLARAEVARTQVARGVPAVGSLTLVYDHHVRDLTERLNKVQHELGDRVRSTLHVHLDVHYCMEVIILRGRSDELQRIAERLLATRGVKQGGIEIVTEMTPAHDHSHPHPHDHDHDHDPPPRAKRRRA